MKVEGGHRAVQVEKSRTRSRGRKTELDLVAVEAKTVGKNAV